MERTEQLEHYIPITQCAACPNTLLCSTAGNLEARRCMHCGILMSVDIGNNWRFWEESIAARRNTQDLPLPARVTTEVLNNSIRAFEYCIHQANRSGFIKMVRPSGLPFYVYENKSRWGCVCRGSE